MATQTIPDEVFEWSYSVCRLDTAGAQPLQYFQRIKEAKAFKEQMEKEYPEIPLDVFVRGDQAYYGNEAAHEQIH